VLGDDPADDRQAEAAAAALRRIVRHEQFVAVRRRDPRTVVGDENASHAVHTIVAGLDDDRRRIAVGTRRCRRAAKSLGGIVDQVYDNPAHLFHVDADPWQFLCEAPFQPDVAKQAVVETQRV
jgi:hypothetical protein